MVARMRLSGTFICTYIACLVIPHSVLCKGSLKSHAYCLVCPTPHFHAQCMRMSSMVLEKNSDIFLEFMPVDLDTGESLFPLRQELNV